VNGHGDTNGHGNGYLGRLERLLAFHTDAAHAIKVTLDLLTGSGSDNKTSNGAPVLAQAIALDRARRKKRGRSKPTTSSPSNRVDRRPGQSKADLLARRKRTARFLAKFSKTVPRTSEDLGAKLGAPFTPLIRWGYITKKGGAYLRTDKAFDPATLPPGGGRELAK
jgi:hypothetical protein